MNLDDPAIQIDPDARIERRTIAEGVECVVVDDCLVEPGRIREYAAASAGAFEHQDRAYPGRVMPLPDRATAHLLQFTRRHLARVFGFLRGGVEWQAQLSLTTTQPDDFTWIQRLPHSDPRAGEGRRNLALLVYLFASPDLGGTAFFRWRDPAYWRAMTARQLDDPNAGLDELRARYALFREPACYPCESNEAVERLGEVPARFNRLIAYYGDVPHSACIRHADRLVDDPRRGRLTLNAFASVLTR